MINENSFNVQDYIKGLVTEWERKQIIILHNLLVKICPVGSYLSTLRDENDMVNGYEFRQRAEFGLKFCEVCPSACLHECKFKPFLSI